MKKILPLLLFILVTMSNATVFGQSDYFLGKRFYCEKPTDKESRKLYKLGIDCINQNQYIGAANKIFQDLIKKDSTFCDAWFFAGYTFRLSNMNKEAMVMYYVADSLAQNRSIEFKQNLAAASMLVDNLELSRKKYKEITQYFPENSEGYYGIALTSTMIGDVEYGLENAIIAETKDGAVKKDVQFLRAVLLTLNGKHQESLKYYEKAKSKFSELDDFNGNYALSLYEVATVSGDQKQMEQAKEHYSKIKDKDALTPETRAKFEKL